MIPEKTGFGPPILSVPIPILRRPDAHYEYIHATQHPSCAPTYLFAGAGRQPAACLP